MHTSLERLQQIERERIQTQSDIAFQRWMHELNVGRMYKDRQPLWNAKEVMQEWNINRYNTDRIVVNQ